MNSHKFRLRLKEFLPSSVFDDYSNFLGNPEILAEANEIVKHGAPGNRSVDERLSNSIKGLSLQYAIGQWLLNLGYDVLIAPPKAYHYDLEVRGHHISEWIKVDVKGRWEGKFFQQSKWEAETIRKLNDRVLYLCIDITPQGLKHYGQCWSDNLEPSQYDCPWVKQIEEIL